MLVIIGCGNPTRSDDGVGCAVVRRLLCELDAGASDLRVLDAGTDGMAVMFAARGADELIIVDASRSGSAAGAVYEVPGDVLERPYAPSLNLHDFRWENALATGRIMFASAFPARVTVLLVEAATVDYGLTLSAPVTIAADTVVARLHEIIATYRTARLPAVCSA